MQFVDRFVGGMTKNGVIKQEEQEIVAFGLYQSILLGLNLLSMLVLSLIFRATMEGIVFLAAFWPLRIYAGGYHADTAKKCYCMSMLAMAGIFAGMKYLFLPKMVYIVLALLSMILIWLLAPQGNENKPLDEVECVVYRKRTRLILAGEILVLVAGVAINQAMVFKTIANAFALVAVLLIMGRIKSSYRE